MPKVVITMPAFRAERTLAKTVADIPHGFADLLILVDDASPDNTAQLARELGIDVYVHPQNLGYGGNQKTCYTEALRSGADIVVLLHPDYQYEPKAVPLLIAPILAGDADMTFGSRFAGLGDPLGGGMPVYRYVGNRLTTVLENLLLGSRFTEMHSGLRAYTRRCLLSLPFLSYSNDFAFDSQILVDAVTFGQRVVEVPIPTRYTKESSSISIGRSSRYIAASLAYCARRVAERGRRGRRSPVAHPERMFGSSPSSVPPPDEQCFICGGSVHSLKPVGTRCGRCGLVSNPASRPGPVPANDSVESATADRVIETIGGYAVRGDALAVVGRGGSQVVGAATARGWRTIAAEHDVATLLLPGLPSRRPGGESQDRRNHVDALVLLDSLGESPLDELRKARSVVDPEGILTVVAPYLAARTTDVGPGSPRHLFTPGSLHAALARTGFRMIAWFSPGALAGSAPLGRRGHPFSHATAQAGQLQLAVGRPAERAAPITSSAEG